MLKHIGHNCYVDADRVFMVVEAKGNSSKRARKDAAERKTLVDATAGNKTRSLLFVDTQLGHVVSSTLQSETAAARINESSPRRKKGISKDDRDLNGKD